MHIPNMGSLHFSTNKHIDGIYSVVLVLENTAVQTNSLHHDWALIDPEKLAWREYDSIGTPGHSHIEDGSKQAKYTEFRQSIVKS